MNGVLNVEGINCLRAFAGYGNVVWGARTLAGADLDESPFKYVSTRRLANFIQQSLQQFRRHGQVEPNGQPLWSMLATETTAFMSGLFGAGAFTGASATQAFDVACDATTTSVADRQAGIVNLSVGFAPISPAVCRAFNIDLRRRQPTTTQ